MDTFSEEAVREAAGCTARQLKVWTDALESHGYRAVGGRMPVHHALAVGAALRFSAAKVSRARINVMFKMMLRMGRISDDWLLVDRRKRYPIEFEFGRVEGTLNYFDPKPPIVFDPVPFLDRLRQAEQRSSE